MFDIQKVDSLNADELGSLCELLTDTVDNGASVGFLSPLAPETARDYWQAVNHALAGNLCLWIAKADGKIVGTVQLDLSGKQNGRHRAELQKLMVRSNYRRRGLGSGLLIVAEQYALEQNRTLLFLDTQQGSAAESVYQRNSWTRVGEIPDFAASPDGTLHATVFYFKQVGF